MTDSVLSKGVIEISVDATKLRAGIDDAKRRIKDLGATASSAEATKAQSASIDRYVRGLALQATSIGKSAEQSKLLALGLRGANDAQLAAAASSLKLISAHEDNVKTIALLRTGLVALGTVAATTATALGVLGIKNIDFADHLHDLSLVTKISVEDLAGLSLLAKQTGTDLDGLAKGINKMSVAMGKDPGAFKALGITATDSIGALKQFADIFNLLPDINQRNALAQKVFSKSWAELGPALAEGSKNIGAIIEKGTRLSGVTTEMADRADEFHDRLEELKISSAAFGAEFLPTLISIVNKLLAARDGAKGFSDAFQNFFSINSEQSKAPAAALEEVNKQLAAVRKEAEEFRAKGVLAKMLDIDKPFAINAEIDRLLKQQEMLSKLSGSIATNAGKIRRPELGTPKAPDTAKDAAARAARFLQEPKKDTSVADTARQEAQAQLAFDLAQIKKSSDATISTFANAEKIMEAQRAAALIDDGKYYAAKLSFILKNSDEQEAELNKEISRLQRETFTGKTAAKDRIDNDRKIADAQAKIAEIRADADTKIQVNSIQEAAANNKIAQSYIDAKEAADAYIDSIIKRNQLELAGVGRGTQFRDIQAGRSQIDDKFNSDRQSLERDLRNQQISKSQFDLYLKTAQDTYSKEIILYDQRTEALLGMQRDWVSGATEALNNYYDESRNIAKQTEDLFSHAFQGAEDALVEFSTAGKFNFKSMADAAKKLADSIVSDLTRMTIKENITGPLAKKAKEFLGGSVAAAVPEVSGAAGSVASNAASTAAAAALTTVGTSATAVGVQFGALAATITPLDVVITTLSASAGAAAVALDAMAASSAVSGAGSSLGGAADILGSFDTGINFVPKTGIYQLHKGETVTPQGASRGGSSIVIQQSFAKGTDMSTVNQAAVAAGSTVRRALARNG